MTDTNNQDELSALKDRATMLGLNYHPSIGLDKLREKVNEALETKPVTKDVSPPEEETAGQKRFRLKQEAHKLIRVRVVCMNPAKTEWEGEIFTVGNSALGSIKKYVPFNNDEGWHIPHIIYQALKDRKCQVFTTKRIKGINVREGKLISEFAIEVLPPLTGEELKELAQRQAMSNSIDN